MNIPNTALFSWAEMKIKSKGVSEMSEQLYIYYWGNNKTPEGRLRLKFKGRKCRVLVRDKRNTVKVEFVDNGEQITCSRWALRKAKGEMI